MKPAIDFGLSVSRIGNKAQWSAMKELSKTLRLDYLQYKELIQMTQLHTTGLSKDAEQRLKRGEVLNQLIVQGKNLPISLETQIVYLLGLNLGLLDNLSGNQTKQFKEEILGFINKRFPEYVIEVRKTRELSPDLKQKLQDGLKEYLGNIAA
jgi:F-type H+-transporting ATPase subunit alpha